jgi:ubiquinone/menaquinone biosynthesis C-methylase UbiE
MKMKLFRKKIYTPKPIDGKLKLEIGPGRERIPGFYSLNAVKSDATDFICDCGRQPLPFSDDAFDLIYSSHFLEHIPWFKVAAILDEMHRCIKPGGAVEIWVPDALKIARVIIDAEEGRLSGLPDGWENAFNPENSPYVWANGRMFWGANPAYPSEHRALYTFKYLKRLLEKHGFRNVQQLDLSEAVNGHGWINLGVRAFKE